MKVTNEFKTYNDNGFVNEDVKISMENCGYPSKKAKIKMFGGGLYEEYIVNIKDLKTAILSLELVSCTI